MINVSYDIHILEKWTGAVLKLYSFYSNDPLGRAAAGDWHGALGALALARLESPSTFSSSLGR